MAGHWQGEYLAMVQDCLQRFDYLSDWEKIFVKSLRGQMDKPNFVIRPRQIESLESIWERVSSKPLIVTKTKGVF